MTKLLIVDDEFRTREGIMSFIRRSNLPVDIVGAASNGMEAVSMAKSASPDIVITDVRMPKMDGIHLAFAIREFLPNCQFIFISAYSDKEYLKAAISLKTVGYVEKPIDFDELLSSLNEAIRIINDHQKLQTIIAQHTLVPKNMNTFDDIALAVCTSTNMQNPDIRNALRSQYPDFARQSAFCTLLIQLSSQTDTPTTQTGLKQFRSAITCNDFSYLLTQKKPDLFIMHIANDTLSTTETLTRITQQIYDDLRENLSKEIRLFLAVGLPVTTPEDISSSYIQAVICLKKLFFVNYNNICYFQENEDENFHISYTVDHSVIQEFQTALQNNNFQQANAIVVKLFYEMRSKKYKFESSSIKDVYYQLLVHLNTICKERGISTVFSCDGDYIWEIIAKQDTIFALQEYLSEKLTAYANEVSSKSGISAVVFRIQQYVAMHYQEPDLSINKMALDLYFTPAYLCQVFKTETGNTINAYLTEYRIAKAKLLLLDKNIKLFEVASAVGYKDPNYFSRQFKKLLGITPSTFRDKYIL